MSARLLGLAFGARVPSHAAKIVLLKLVDCCDDEGRNIYPSVATLATAAECAERTVQRVLRLFCAIGLLRLVREGGAGKGSTRCYEMDIRLLFELSRPGLFAELEARNGGAVDAEETAGHAQNACDKAEEAAPGETLRVTPCHPNEALRVTLTTSQGDIAVSPNPLREPSRVEKESAWAHAAGATSGSPGGHDESAGLAGDGATSGPAVTLDDFRKVWPRVGVDDQAKLATAWAELPFAERRAAIDGVAPFLAELKAAKRSTVPASWSYLSQRRWTLIDAEAAARKASAGVIAVAPWSREWWALLFGKLKRGERCSLMVEWAIKGTGMTCKPGDMPSAEAITAVQPYPCDGPEMEAWRPWFRARRCEMPTFRGSYRVFLPAPAPPEDVKQASGF
ncbi:MAG: helix-turn-helix domain-containing protein [Proteobacteria bacterium]|nr:helix-turn-helix domain-containing protein [Pseudomonadota bacterium]